MRELGGQHGEHMATREREREPNASERLQRHLARQRPASRVRQREFDERKQTRVQGACRCTCQAYRQGRLSASVWRSAD